MTNEGFAELCAAIWHAKKGGSEPDKAVSCLGEGQRDKARRLIRRQRDPGAYRRKRRAGWRNLVRATRGRLSRLLGCSCATALLSLAPPIRAEPLLALDINPMTQAGNWTPFYGFDEFTLRTNGMYGWTFYLAQPATITGLAWYAQAPGGLSHDHQVGIWQDQSGSTNAAWLGTNVALVVSATIPGGTNAVLDGVWRKVDLGSPITLPVGRYVIAGTYYTQNADVVKYVEGSDLPRDPRITIGSPVFTDPNPALPLFRIPDGAIVNDGVELGPNMFIVPGSGSLGTPALRIAWSGDHVVLSWPLWAANFVLETSNSLGSGGAWNALTNTVGSDGHSVTYTNSAGSAAAFYRLRKP